jgi:membrane protease YdiL (CAAX protease family)
MTFSAPESPLPHGELSSPETPGAPEIYLSPQNLGNLNIPEDIRTSWGWLELGMFLLVGIFSYLVMFVMASIYLVARYHLNAAQLQNLFSANAAYAVGFEVAWSVILLAFLILMIRVYHGQRFWISIGWRKLRTPAGGLAIVILLCVVGGGLLAVAVGILSRFIETNAHVPMEDLFQSRANILWLMAYGILFAPFWEETLFRGFLYPVFARQWGIRGGIVVTGLLFGAMHAAQLWGGWGQIVLLTFVGVVLTWARARSGTVLASYLVHVSYNTFLFVAFFIGTHGLHQLPQVH